MSVAVFIQTRRGGAVPPSLAKGEGKSVGKNNLVELEYPEMKKSKLDASHCLLICMGDKCRKKGGKIRQAIEDDLAKRDLSGRVTVLATGCMHRCDHGPNVAVYPMGVAYGKAGKKDAGKIVGDVAKMVNKA